MGGVIKGDSNIIDRENGLKFSDLITYFNFYECFIILKFIFFLFSEYLKC